MVRIGISGWRYDGWRRVFYPPRLPQVRELEFASREVNTIEINGSHYSLQSLESYRKWYDATPSGFVFAVKGPRYLTHMLRFRDESARSAIANFFASGVLALGEKLGPFLWQFPATYSFQPDRFDAFLAFLPRTLNEAASLSRHHDSRVKTPWFDVSGRGRLRHAIEIRHSSFCTAEFARLLRKYRTALVVSDSVAGWPHLEDVTADFVYLRLHGTETLYGGSYSEDALAHWASRIQMWAAGGQPDDAALISKVQPARRSSRDVFCYFDNDKKVQAPFDARRLMKLVDARAEERPPT